LDLVLFSEVIPHLILDLVTQLCHLPHGLRFLPSQGELLIEIVLLPHLAPFLHRDILLSLPIEFLLLGSLEPNFIYKVIFIILLHLQDLVCPFSSFIYFLHHPLLFDLEHGYSIL